MTTAVFAQYITAATTSTTQVGQAANVLGGAAGSLHYQSAANTTAMLTIGTANQILTVNAGATAPQYTTTSSVQVGYATTSGFAASFNTSTLVALAVSVLNTTTAQVGFAVTATSAATAYSLATLSSAVVINNATAATSTTTGALQVLNGGVGIGGGVFVGGTVTATNFVLNGYQVSTGTINTSTLMTTAVFAQYITAATTSTTQVGQAANVLGGAAGSLHYQSAANTTAMLTIGTANQILTVNAGATAPQYTTTSSVQVGYATTSGFAASFNTSTLVALAVNVLNTTTAQVGFAVTATSAATAYSTIGSHTTGTGIYGNTFNGSTGVSWSLNTSTLVTTAVFAQYITAATTSTTQVGQAVNVLGGAIGSIHYQSAANTTAMLANATTSGWVLGSVSGAAPSWQLVSTSTLVTTAVFAQYITAATTSTTQVGQAVNVLGGAIGSIHYQSAANTTAMLANATTSGWVLGSVSGAAPSWQLAAAATATTATSAATAYSLATLSTAVIINLATGASSTNTGALQVLNGGVGIGGGMVIAGIVTATNTLGVSSTITGAVRVAGGVGIGGGLFVGGTITATNLLVNGYAVSTSTAFNGGTITNPLIVNNATASTSTTTGAIQVVNGGVGVGGDVYVGGGLFATTKSFLIDHPTKPDMKLRYGSLEGPENGVYVRGQLSGDVIELPDYWTKLVDPGTITVQLTPIGKPQNLFVEKIENNSVYVGQNGWFKNDINCFYIVYAERADIEKLVVEI